MATTYVIIVAAGSGSRFGSEIPKQFLDLQGKPVVAHAVDAFRNALPDAEIRLVLSEEMIPLWNGLCAEHGFESPIIVPGGATRWESVKNALSSLSEAPASATVMIHDGARPLVGSDVILRAAAAARNTDGAIPAIPVTDSLRQMDADGVRSTPANRTGFRAVQTPQAFSLWRLREAYTLPYQDDFTDDASVLAAAGFDNIVLTKGSHENIKITTPVDLLIARAIMCGQENA